MPTSPINDVPITVTKLLMLACRPYAYPPAAVPPRGMLPPGYPYAPPGMLPPGMLCHTQVAFFACHKPHRVKYIRPSHTAVNACASTSVGSMHVCSNSAPTVCVAACVLHGCCCNTDAGGTCSTTLFDSALSSETAQTVSHLL